MRVVIATTHISDEFGVRWGGLGFDAESMLEDKRTYGRLHAVSNSKFASDQY